jgi:hypothetical protein
LALEWGLPAAVSQVLALVAGSAPELKSAAEPESEMVPEA